MKQTIVIIIIEIQMVLTRNQIITIHQVFCCNKCFLSLSFSVFSALFVVKFVVQFAINVIEHYYSCFRFSKILNFSGTYGKSMFDPNLVRKKTETLCGFSIFTLFPQTLATPCCIFLQCYISHKVLKLLDIALPSPNLGSCIQYFIFY